MAIPPLDPPAWVPEGSLKRVGKKGVKIKIFGPVFLGVSPEIDPETR